MADEDHPPCPKPSPPGHKRKRVFKQASVACNPCRLAKTRCDNARPVCGRCAKAQIACGYDTESATESRSAAARRRNSDLVSVQRRIGASIDWLRSQPGDVVLACMQRLREAGDDPLEELCDVVDDERERLAVVSTLVAPENALEPPPLVFDQPLDLQYQFGQANAYSSFAPTSSSSSPQQPFPVMTGLDGVALNLPVQQSFLDGPAGFFDRHVKLPSPDSGLGFPSNSNEMQNLQAANVDIRHWTNVPISDELAVDLITAYMTIEHPVYGFFDASLFLESLVEKNCTFCSPLLVNALLFWTSCTFRVVKPEASTYTDTFLQAAQVLYEPERFRDTVLNVASLIIMAIGAVCYGDDKLGREYMIACVQMAERMQLMGVERKRLEEFDKACPRMQSMISYVAWGVFNFSTVYAIHFHDAHSATFAKAPPLVPIPSSSDSAAAVAENIPPTAITPFDQPSSRPASFPYFCRFWRIAHGIAMVYYRAKNSLQEHVPVAWADSRFPELLEWSNSLPEELVRPEGMPHNVAEMLICYHATVMDLYRPFVREPDLVLATQQTPATLAHDQRKPESKFLLHLRKLQALISYYHTTFRRRPEAYSIAWVHGPLYVAAATTRLPPYATQKQDFIDCIHTFRDLVAAHRVVLPFVKALCEMALRAGILTAEEALAEFNALTAVEGKAEQVVDHNSKKKKKMNKSCDDSADHHGNSRKRVKAICDGVGHQEEDEDEQEQGQEKTSPSSSSASSSLLLPPEPYLARLNPADTKVVVDQDLSLKSRDLAVGDYLALQFDQSVVFQQFCASP